MDGIEQRAANRSIEIIQFIHGTTEIPCALQIGMDAFGRKIFRGRLIGKSPNLHIPESVVGEPGFECFLSVAAQYQQLGLIAPARMPCTVLRIQGAVGFKHFVELELHGLPPAAPYTRFDPACKVFTEIHQIDTGARFRNPHGFQFLRHTHRRHRIRRQFTQRRWDMADIAPQAIAETRFVPTVHGLGMVDRFPRANAVIDDFTMPPFPRPIRHDHVARSRFVFDDDIEPDFRRRMPIRIVHPENIPCRQAVPAVPQQDTKGIASG